MCAYIAYKSHKWAVTAVLKKVKGVKEHEVPHTYAEVKSNLKSVMTRMKLRLRSYQSVNNTMMADGDVSMSRAHIRSYKVPFIILHHFTHNASATSVHVEAID